MKEAGQKQIEWDILRQFILCLDSEYIAQYYFDKPFWVGLNLTLTNG